MILTRKKLGGVPGWKFFAGGKSYSTHHNLKYTTSPLTTPPTEVVLL